MCDICFLRKAEYIVHATDELFCSTCATAYAMGQRELEVPLDRQIQLHDYFKLVDEETNE